MEDQDMSQDMDQDTQQQITDQERELISFYRQTNAKGKALLLETAQLCAIAHRGLEEINGRSYH